ncbi:hypothetical protein ADUPG1_013194 [Aduncisulcus paluster]|uniref:Uncharacterized protein n=1 Tax=Aduncisulcus paluster TaxID=2918883 RepID=A0ABQ5K242_9EUKA|nr:hypothetical protein ADUPG1_013194 [Aduncisulcus paluster]
MGKNYKTIPLEKSCVVEPLYKNQDIHLVFDQYISSPSGPSPFQEYKLPNDEKSGWIGPYNDKRLISCTSLKILARITRYRPDVRIRRITMLVQNFSPPYKMQICFSKRKEDSFFVDFSKSKSKEKFLYHTFDLPDLEMCLDFKTLHIHFYNKSNERCNVSLHGVWLESDTAPISMADLVSKPSTHAKTAKKPSRLTDIDIHLASISDDPSISNARKIFRQLEPKLVILVSKSNLVSPTFMKTSLELLHKLIHLDPMLIRASIFQIVCDKCLESIHVALLKKHRQKELNVVISKMFSLVRKICTSQKKCEAPSHLISIMEELLKDHDLKSIMIPNIMKIMDFLAPSIASRTSGSPHAESLSRMLPLVAPPVFNKDEFRRFVLLVEQQWIDWPERMGTEEILHLEFCTPEYIVGIYDPFKSTPVHIQTARAEYFSLVRNVFEKTNYFPEISSFIQGNILEWVFQFSSIIKDDSEWGKSFENPTFSSMFIDLANILVSCGIHNVFNNHVVLTGSIPAIKNISIKSFMMLMTTFVGIGMRLVNPIDGHTLALDPCSIQQIHDLVTSIFLSVWGTIQHLRDARAFKPVIELVGKKKKTATFFLKKQQYKCGIPLIGMLSEWICLGYNYKFFEAPKVIKGKKENPITPSPLKELKMVNGKTLPELEQSFLAYFSDALFAMMENRFEYLKITDFFNVIAFLSILKFPERYQVDDYWDLDEGDFNMFGETYGEKVLKFFGDTISSDALLSTTSSSVPSITTAPPAVKVPVQDIQGIGQQIPVPLGPLQMVEMPMLGQPVHFDLHTMASTLHTLVSLHPWLLTPGGPPQFYPPPVQEERDTSTIPTQVSDYVDQKIGQIETNLIARLDSETSKVTQLDVSELKEQIKRIERSQTKSDSEIQATITSIKDQIASLSKEIDKKGKKKDTKQEIELLKGSVSHLETTFSKLKLDTAKKIDSIISSEKTSQKTIQSYDAKFKSMKKDKKDLEVKVSTISATLDQKISNIMTTLERYMEEKDEQIEASHMEFNDRLKSYLEKHDDLQEQIKSIMSTISSSASSSSSSSSSSEQAEKSASSVADSIKTMHDSIKAMHNRVLSASKRP